MCLHVLCRGKEQTLPDGSTVTALYYTVRYNAYPDTTDVLNGSSLRIPPMRADDDAQSADELAEEMRQLFESVRAEYHHCPCAVCSCASECCMRVLCRWMQAMTVRFHLMKSQPCSKKSKQLLTFDAVLCYKRPRTIFYCSASR